VKAGAPEELPIGILTFAGFRLDPSRAELTRAGVAVPLRPKAFALLSYLTGHAGRILSKRELLVNVWPDVVVTDDSLSQCVVELRAALGDSDQDIVKTVPRMGYRFDAAVQLEPAPAAATPPPEAAATLTAPRPERPRSAPLIAACAVLVCAISFGTAAMKSQTRPGIEASLAAGRSLAVIPFVDLSEPKAAYFAAGVTQEVITDLGRLDDALLVAAGDAYPLTASGSVDVRRVARELGVRHVLTGSVQRDGDRVRVHARLSRTDTGALEWSDRFEYEHVADWHWRGDISQRVAAALDDRLLEGAINATRHEVRSGEAIDEWMRGAYLAKRFTTHAELLRARRHFEQAIAADPQSTNALSGLAGTYIEEVVYRWATDRKRTLEAAKVYGRRAMAIDPNHQQALRALGNAHMFDADFDEAMGLFTRALQVNPNTAFAQRDMASVLMFTGRFDEALPYARASLRLAPLDLNNVWKSHAILGQSLLALGHDDEAREELRRAVDAGPAMANNHFMMAGIEAQRGDLAAARRYLADALRLRPGTTIASMRANASSPHPAYVANLERFRDGLRLVGLPEGAAEVAAR